MMHKSRTWCIFPIATKEDLAHKLADSTWCLCTAFEIGNYLFLNDATFEDGAAEYAVYAEIAVMRGSWEELPGTPADGALGIGMVRITSEV